MKLKPEIGIGKLSFGLSQNEVKKLIGQPDVIRKDSNFKNRTIWIYNDEKIRLSFYESEERKLGYIETSNPKLIFGDFFLINSKIEEAKYKFAKLEIKEWEIDEFDSFASYFNEKLWITIHVEYERVTNIELGVPFEDDENYK